MHRRLTVALLALAAVASAGCIIHLGVKEFPRCKHVVEVDGELYIVDLKPSHARKLEIETAIRNERTTRTEIDSIDD